LSFSSLRRPPTHHPTPLAAVLPPNEQLWRPLGWLSLAAAPVVAFLLLGTENIGAQLEEPFHVLAVPAICAAMRANVTEMARSAEELQRGGAAAGSGANGGAGGSAGIGRPPPQAPAPARASLETWRAAEGAARKGRVTYDDDSV